MIILQRQQPMTVWDTNCFKTNSCSELYKVYIDPLRYYNCIFCDNDTIGSQLTPDMVGYDVKNTCVLDDGDTYKILWNVWYECPICKCEMKIEDEISCYFNG